MKDQLITCHHCGRQFWTGKGRRFQCNWCYHYTTPYHKLVNAVIVVVSLVAIAAVVLYI